MRVAPLLCVLLACTGTILSPEGSREDDWEDPMHGPADPPGPHFVPGSERPTCDSDVCAGTTPLVRLTRVEYLRSIESAFGVLLEFDPARLPADGAVAQRFSSNAGKDTGNMVEAKTRSLQDSADSIAAMVAPSITLACNPGADPSGCGRELFERHAPSLFRGPVESSWGDAYATLYADTHADEGAEVALEVTLSTMLQSPLFIYREEQVGEGEAQPLNGFAIASRLAAFLWRSAPDDALLAAATRGELDTAEGVRAQAERMLDDAKLNEALELFHVEWLGLNDIELSEPLADAMRRETTSFVVRAFREDWAMERLFTDTASDVDDELLATHYGVASGTRVEVPGRVGLLTHASVLSAHTGEPVGRQIHRGAFLISDVLCRELGEIPDDVDTSVLEDVAEELGPDASAREQLDAATGGPACNGCHSQINPAGFAFDAFDGEGRFLGEGHDTGGTLLVDTTNDDHVTFEDHRTLIDGLLGSGALSSCYAYQWVRFALGREPTADDATSVWDVQQQFVDQEYSLRQLLLSVVTTDAFLSRAAPAATEAPRCE